MAEARRVARGLPLSEVIFLTLFVLVVWAGTENSQGGPGSPWFANTLFGVPLHYVLFAGLVILLLPYVLVTPRFALTERLKSTRLWAWLVLSWAVISLALAVALLRAVPELFADWRNLAVVAVVVLLSSRWLAAQEWRRFAIVDLVITVGLLCVPILIAYGVGFGSSVGGVRTTTFEPATLYVASFAATAGAWNLLMTDELMVRLRTSLLGFATLTSSLVVLLSLRRSYWVILGVGAMAVVIAYLRSRAVRGVRVYAVVMVGTIVVVGAFLALGADTIVDRIESFNPTSTGAFSNTNQDHMNDLIDAWHVIERDPVIGFGIGRTYETDLIAEWKQDSFDVHNAILHVWLKFGIAGAVAYVGFHASWIRSAMRKPNLGSVPIGAYILGVMVATLFATWPYGRFQVSVFMGLLLALFLTEPRSAIDSRHEPESAALAAG